jgi:Predicted membrane protein
MKKFAMILAVVLATATMSACVPWWGPGGPGGHGGGGHGGHDGGGGGGYSQGGPGGR